MSIAPLLVAAAALAPGAWGQDSGPIVIGTRQELKAFHFSDFRLALEVSAQIREDELKRRQDDTKQRDQEQRLIERLILDTNGFIGHPNLVEFDLSVGLRLEQISIDSDTVQLAGSSDEVFFEHDARALILRQTKNPITVYSRRSQTTINRQFGASLDNELLEHGIQLRLLSEVAPSFFQYFHRDQEQTSAGGVTDLDLTQDTFQWQSQFTPGEGQLFTWDYTFDRVDEGGELRRNNQFDRHDAIAIHTWDFGPVEHRSNLRSNIQLYKETGLFPLERWRWDETLRLRHTRKFETRYIWVFDRQELLESRQSMYRGSTGFRHELFESLVTNFDIGASRLRVHETDFDSEQRFVLANLEYDKKVPGGILDATLTGNLNWQKDSESGGTVQIANEPHTFNVADQFVINRRNVQDGSIFMTDSAGVIIYSEGIDYTVRNFGDRVEVRRVAGGAIAPGQTVLLDYRIGPEPGSRTNTSGLGASLRYGFKEGPLAGLSIYASYFRQRQDRELEAPVPDLLPVSDIDEYIYGVEYDYEPFFAKAEWRHRDSTISPFDSMRLEARYRESFGRGNSLSIGLTYDDIDRTEDDLRTILTLISGRWNWRITDELHSSLFLIWRHEEDSMRGNVQGLEEQLDLNWRYRQTSAYLSLRHSNLESARTETDNFSVLVGLRREF